MAHKRTLSHDMSLSVGKKKQAKS